MLGNALFSFVKTTCSVWLILLTSWVTDRPQEMAVSMLLAGRWQSWLYFLDRYYSLLLHWPVSQIYLGNCPFALSCGHVCVYMHVCALRIVTFAFFVNWDWGFCCHCVSLLTKAAVCGRPWAIGLYILSLKEVICTLLCQCQENQCDLVWLFGGCCYCFFFPLEEVPQAETLRDPRRQSKWVFTKRSWIQSFRLCRNVPALKYH